MKNDHTITHILLFVVIYYLLRISDPTTPKWLCTLAAMLIFVVACITAFIGRRT
jgi:hypothetical protein